MREVTKGRGDLPVKDWMFELLKILYWIGEMSEGGGEI